MSLLGLGGMTPGMSFATSDRAPLLTTPVTTDLGQHMIDQIDNRIAGFPTTPAGFRSLWTTRGNMTGGWQLNTTSLWSNQGTYALDFTGTSPWSSTSSIGGYSYGATLISRRHVLLAEHVYRGSNIGYGFTIVFVDKNNQVITRTVLNRAKIGATDIDIGVLDADVPSSIPHYPLISYADFSRYVSSANIPIIRLDQYDNAVIQDIRQGNVSRASIDAGASTGIRAPYTSSGGISGDSGNPNFAVIGDRLVLLGAQYFPSSFPNAGNYISEINAAMTALGGGYQVTQLDLSHFTPYTPSIPNQTMNVVEQSATGTVVGTVQVSGVNNAVNPLTNFNIVAGNMDNGFSIHPITGVITVNQPSGIDFSKIQAIPITVSARDSSVVTKNLTGTVTISISYNPNIPHPIVSVLGSYVWTERISSGSRRWSSISSSANGEKLAAVEAPGYVWVSADSGATWTQQSAPGTRNWSFIKISADGTHLIALDGNTGAFWTAISSGAGVPWNWTERTNAGIKLWAAAASSSDGLKIAIVSDTGSLFISSDAGTTWTERVIPGGPYLWSTITSSADGTKLVVGASNYDINNEVISTIFTSTDSGTSWASRLTLNVLLYTLASSADGVKLVAGTDIDPNSTSIYTSNDSGVTWTAQVGSGVNSWWQVASSADGARLAAADTIYLWISKDSGLTWNRDANLPLNVYGIAPSSDGSKLAAAIFGGNIWTAANGLTPSITTNNPSAIFSTSATLNGFINDTDLSSAITRGFQYGTTTAYSLSTTENGSFGAGAFSASINGLNCGTTYYVRAYATNTRGTTFGLTRVFVPQCPSILTYSANSNGSITGVSPQLVETMQNGTAVTAVANTGYSFVNWSDGSTANPRTDANVTASLSITANFAANTPTPPSPTDGDYGDVPLPAWATALLFSALLFRIVRSKRAS